MAELKNTPLREFHLEMGAKMVPRSGWNLPLNFSEGAADEHECCRSRAALFDLCADGRFRIAYPGCPGALSKLLSGGEPLPEPGQCRRDYFVTDQGIAAAVCCVSCMAPEDFFVTVPFQCSANAVEIFKKAKVEAVSLSEYLGCIGISGPESIKVLTLCGVSETDLPRRNETRLLELDGLRAIVSFSDLFDDTGFEINFNAECTDQIWDLLLETDLPWPAGLAAQESLRIEMGIPWANELTVSRSAAHIAANTAQVLFEGRRAPFAGVKLFDDENREVAVVTSGSFCPALKCAAALAFFFEGVPAPGMLLHADANGVAVSGRVKK